MHSERGITCLLKLLVFHSVALLIAWNWYSISVMCVFSRLLRDAVCYRVKKLWLSTCGLQPSWLVPKGSRTPAGAICIQDKAIHHLCCSTQFRVPLQRASGSSEQLYMYVLVMRALETCLVALKAGLNGWRDSTSQFLRLNPQPSSRTVPNVGF